MIIKVSGNEKKFIDKCLKYKINIRNIKRYKDYMLVSINVDDFETVVRICYFSEITLYQYLGLKGFIIFLKKYMYDLLMLILFILLIFFISNVMVKVDINHENKKLKDYIKKTIYDYNIKPYHIRINPSKLNKISDEILKNNRDKLDFISIEARGMKYIVNIEERIIDDDEIIEGFCHIKSTKNGVIKLINASSGVELVEAGSYVKKGDILISGEIKLNDEVKNNVCANGLVLADVWYKIKVSIPKVIKRDESTGKSRYNFKFKDKYFYKKNYDLYKEKCLFSLGKFKIYKQYEYKKIDVVKTHDELVSESLEIAKKSILEKVSKNSRVIDEKVLKESENNSTIELEIFVNVEENIGILEKYEVGEIIDSE